MTASKQGTLGQDFNIQTPRTQRRFRGPDDAYACVCDAVKTQAVIHRIPIRADRRVFSAFSMVASFPA